MNEFTDADISPIRHVKYTLRKNIEMLIMTVQKLGSTYETAYYISGGCIGSLLRGEIVNDYDVYFYDKAGADRIPDLFKYDPSYTNYVKLAENDSFYREIKVGDKIITENVDSKAQIIFGAVKDKEVKKGELKIILIATKF